MSSESDLKTQLLRAEEDLRAARFQDAQTLIGEHWREWIEEGAPAHQIANLCRRAGWLQTAQDVIIRAQLRERGQTRLERRFEFNPSKLSEALKCEWAATLVGFGASDEALEILKTHSSAPALFVQALAHISKWEYAFAAAALKEALASARFADSYEGLVAKVNLLAAQIVLKEKSAIEDLHKELSEKVDPEKHLRLRSNLHELVVQAIALRLLSSENSRVWQKTSAKLSPREELYLKKWEAVSLVQKGMATQALKEFRVIKKTALAIEEFETLRDCDLQIAKVTRDHRLFNTLALGSNLPHYRAHIEAAASDLKISSDELYKKPCEVRLEYSKVAKSENAAKEKIIYDFQNNRLERGTEKMQLKKPSAKIESLIQCLFSDFYRPPTLGKVSQTLFSTERFIHTIHGPRISQLCFRLNKYFQSQKIPLSVGIEGISLQVRTKKELSFKLDSPESKDPLLDLIKKNFGEEDFGLRDLIPLTSQSPRQLQRKLKLLTGSNQLSVRGHTWRKKYRLNRSV